LRKRFISLYLLALLCFGSGSNVAHQKADLQDKKNQEVTFEMLRTVLIELDKKVQLARERGNKLTELNAIRALETEYAAKGSAAHQALATLGLTVAPELGNYQEALHFADVVTDSRASQQPTREALKGYKPTNALRALAEIADKIQVIMINEAHHVAQHRAFTIDLLKVLHRKGFTYFAAETLSEEDTKLNERGYPIKHSGYYTNEPVYGDLIRTALKLGYKVIPYEPQYQNAEQRERDQARNLVERILKVNPNAKILVHAGYSHINESGLLAGAPTMAQRFKEMTGIDPFTIDQTVMSERGAREYEHPIYHDAINLGLLTQPTIFKNSQGELWSMEPGKRDVTLFHPRSIYIDGRPSWLRLTNIRGPYRLPKDICKTSARCLVSARIATESVDAVPIDQLEVRAENKATVMMLPRGEFVVDAQDPDGKPIQSFRIKTRKP
jgi:hypothetical protein